MTGTQRLLATGMAVFLAGIPGKAKPDAIGIVVEAAHASLDSLAVSEGTTVFDGDQLSTGSGGTLQLRIGESLLDLTGDSSVAVHENTSKIGRACEVELFSGTAALSEPAGSEAEIVASSARVRAASETRGTFQVQLIGPRELIVFARRGAAEISYQGESATVPEGKSYRVMLRATDEAGAGEAGGKKPLKRGKALVLIAVGAAAVTGIIVWRETRGAESPDRP